MHYVRVKNAVQSEYTFFIISRNKQKLHFDGRYRSNFSKHFISCRLWFFSGFALAEFEIEGQVLAVSYDRSNQYPCYVALNTKMSNFNGRWLGSTKAYMCEFAERCKVFRLRVRVRGNDFSLFSLEHVANGTRWS